MKIVQFIASRGKGGAENVVSSLSNEMHSRNMNIIVLYLKKSLFIKQLDSDIPKVALFFSSRWNPLLYIELLYFFWKYKPDIIHTHGAKSTELIHAISYFISTLHIATKHNARKGKIFNKIRYVTAVSQEVKKSILNPNVYVIYNGITPKDMLQKKIVHPNNPFKIYAIGRLDKIKGFDILIKACRDLAFPFELHIVGEGKEEKYLHSLTKELTLENKIFFDGFQNDIPSLMNQSDLVVINSHSEGFSMVMVESILYAPVLISTKVSGSIEVLDQQFLIDHSTLSISIEKIYNNYPDYYKQFALLKNKFHSKFLLSTITQNYLDYYVKSFRSSQFSDSCDLST